MIHHDLFGRRIYVPVVTATRRKFGYAARPGTGPKKQRCSTCRFCILVDRETRTRKCEVMARLWDIPGSEIKHNAPACSFWQRKPFLNPTLNPHER